MNRFYIFIIRFFIGVFFAVLITRFFYPEAGVFFIAGLGALMISLAYLSEYFRTRRKRAKGADSR